MRPHNSDPATTTLAARATARTVQDRCPRLSMSSRTSTVVLVRQLPACLRLPTALSPVYGQNGDKPKRRQVKTATPKRRRSKTATSQNGDKLKRRQVHGEITKTATNEKVDIATQYERVNE